MSQPLRALELFAGYGGLGLAVERALRAETVAYAEIEPGPVKILERLFPGVPNLRDVTTADWSDAGEVDVISGGSPCQDIAQCGQRRGMTIGTRSGLWASMRDAIADRRPQYVVWENVRSATSAKASSALDLDGSRGLLRAMTRVLGDMASLGYDAEWLVVRASDVGACHQRARVFLLAWDRDQLESWEPTGTAYAEWDEILDAFVTEDGKFYTRNTPPAGALRDGKLYPRENLSAAPLRKNDLLRSPIVKDKDRPRDPKARLRDAGGFYGLADVTSFVLGDTPGFDLSHGEVDPETQRLWGKYWTSVVRHAQTQASPLVPTPTVPAPYDPEKRVLSPRFAEWMMCLPAGHVTDPELELSYAEQITALGNGVVPAQAERAIQLMLLRRFGLES